MKKLMLLLAAMIAVVNMSYSQESAEKPMWAKSFLNQKAPEIVVERYLSMEPNFENKYVLLEFWATWCSACRRAIPKLNELQKEFADELVIMGLSEETEDKVLGMTTPKIEFTSAIDPKGILRKEYEVIGYPHAVLISPEGIVVWEGFPLLKDAELTSEVLRKLMK